MASATTLLQILLWNKDGLHFAKFYIQPAEIQLLIGTPRSKPPLEGSTFGFCPPEQRVLEICSIYFWKMFLVLLDFPTAFFRSFTL